MNHIIPWSKTRKHHMIVIYLSWAGPAFPYCSCTISEWFQITFRGKGHLSSHSPATWSFHFFSQPLISALDPSVNAYAIKRRLQAWQPMRSQKEFRKKLSFFVLLKCQHTAAVTCLSTWLWIRSQSLVRNKNRSTTNETFDVVCSLTFFFFHRIYVW